MKYVVNNTRAIAYQGIVVLTTQEVVDAINFANNALLKC